MASKTLVRKLHPSRYTEMSPKMGAIVGCVLGEQFTEPQIAELVIDGTGTLLARMLGDIGANDIIGSSDDMERNVSLLLDVADLTPEERAEWDTLYALRVTDWRKRNRQEVSPFQTTQDLPQ